jgi:hypothetical protein
MAEEFDWGKHTAAIIRMKAAELMAYADQIEGAKTLEELHKLGLEAMEPKPCNCTDKDKFMKKIEEAKAKPIDWRTMQVEFNRIMHDKNYGRP